MKPISFFISVLICCNSVWCQDKLDFASKSIEDNSIIEVGPTSTLPPNATTAKTSSKSRASSKLVCPGNDTPRAFFSIPCTDTKECKQLGSKNFLCCENRCLKGVPAPQPEPIHSPAFFGLVKQACPTERIPEILEITKCKTDAECTPRICCPEKMLNGEVMGFCRMAQPQFDRFPRVQRFMEPFKLIMSYMQCTPPPPPILDVFPKECLNPLDCFPNLCCQERGRKFCRPPKRSLITLFATVAQRIVPTQTARDFIARIAS